MPKDFDNTGTVSIWERDGKGNAPIMSGTAYAHRDIKKGEAFDVALWIGKSQNPKAPTYTGKVSDPYKKDDNRSSNSRSSQTAGRDYGASDFADEDIPFRQFGRHELV